MRIKLCSNRTDTSSCPLELYKDENKYISEYFERKEPVNMVADEYFGRIAFHEKQVCSCISQFVPETNTVTMVTLALFEIQEKGESFVRA